MDENNLPEGTLQLPPQWSTLAPEVDEMYYFIYWVSVAFTVVIFAAMIYFMWKYRRRPGLKAKPTGHSTALEIGWTFAPLILLVVLFHQGFTGYVRGAVAPEDSIEVRVRGMQWNWEFEHRGGVIDDLNYLRVPVNTPVRLIMSSSDVLHSFFVPAFRVKRDVVPGMYSTLWFEATQETPDIQCESDADCPEGLWCGNTPPGGEARECVLPIFCAEYCGAPRGITASAFDEGGRNTNHSTMMGDLKVITQAEYDEFIELGPPPPASCQGRDDINECWGEQIHQSYCVACHSVDGATQAPAPNWKGLFGNQRQFVDGSSATADENYIRQSILQPQSQIVQGYNNVNMPPFRFSDRQLDAIIAYMRSLNE
ncbi:MAG: hypothetical protein CMN30_11280 [Sandaracinus sp.]|nr:hypothetical protein [Sandaracinus sp.]MAR57352.1 hypothetical protein [Rickettsiales bacterium]|tara:strand:- start:3045 stop:4148 length:1104 start_codon:yes stop_codon:yes gene_type:complete